MFIYGASCTQEVRDTSKTKVKSCNALLHMLLVCIRNYLKSILIYKFLMLDTYHPNIPYLRQQGCEDP